MKKTIRFLTVVISMTLILMLLNFAVSAADSIIAISGDKQVNGKITVTVKVNAPKKMSGDSFQLQYNSDVLKFESGPSSSSGGAGIVKVFDYFVDNPQSSKSYAFTFTGIASGSSQLILSDCRWVLGDDAVEKSFQASSATVVVADAAKSSNANLKSLSLSNGTLSPKFSAGTVNYNATVPYSVSDSKVYATAADSAANVEVSGTSALKVGQNSRVITVTAPSGAQKKYTVTITRLEENASSEEAPVSSVEEPTDNPLDVNVDGTKYTLATDISSATLPNGFAAAETEYNGNKVAVAENTNADFKIYYLKSADSETLIPYLLSDGGDGFEIMKYTVIGSNTYIFMNIPEGYTVSDSYRSTDVDIAGFNVKCYAADGDGMSDFYYTYCFFNNGYRVYKYDYNEGTLQRAPEFSLTELAGTAKSGGLVSRFNILPRNGKVIVIGLLAAVIGAVALLVLIIVKLASSNKDYGYDDELDEYDDGSMFSEDFDDVRVTDTAEKYEASTDETLNYTDDSEE